MKGTKRKFTAFITTNCNPPFDTSPLVYQGSQAQN